jgi:hypothetical protein
VKTFSGNPLISNGRGIKNHTNPRRRVIGIWLSGVDLGLRVRLIALRPSFEAH